MSPHPPSHPQVPARAAYKIHEVAAQLGVSTTTIRRLIDRGLLSPCRATRHILIPAFELDRFLHETTNNNVTATNTGRQGNLA